MAWMWVFLAGLAEIGWMAGIKLSAGFTRWPWIAVTFASAAVSFFCMSLAVRTIPMGTAYAVWTGLGAAGIAAVGIVFFGEPRNLWRIVYIGCILVGIAGLKLTAGD